jgi:hypothetical protein
MLDAERFLEPDCAELPVCRCGREMYIAFTRSSPKTPEIHIRVYNCPACDHEMHLAIWGADAAHVPVGVPVPDIRTADTGHCGQCNGPVGQNTHRVALKLFCSTRCLEEYNDTARKVSLIKEWRDFYSRRL